MAECFVLHFVLPLTISSYLRPPLVWRTCVYPNVPLWKDPFSRPWPSRISDAIGNPFSNLISFGCCWPPSLRIAASSGSHRDWTMSELPHSLLYSSMMLDSWWLSKNWSGMVWRNYLKNLLKLMHLVSDLNQE